MYIHSSHIARIFISPDNIQKVFTAVNLVRIKYKQLKHIKFFRCQIDLLACDKHTTALAVKLQITCLNGLGLFLLLAF